MANVAKGPMLTPAEAGPSQPRRMIEIILFVAAWMGVGFWFPLDADSYLLCGIPLTAFFQIQIRHKPIRALWVRSAPDFRWDRRTVICLGSLLPVPCIGLFHTLHQSSGIDWIRAGWFASAVAGAFAAAYSLQNFTRETLRSLYGCLASAGFYGVIIVVTAAAATHFPARSPISILRVAVESFLAYLPVTFVLEEVTFRGLLDAHVFEPGKQKGIASAVLVSILWGVWHLPVSPRQGPTWLLIMRLVLVHTLVGVPLSLYWRRSKNLAVPAVTHSFVDAIRNALLASFRV